MAESLNADLTRTVRVDTAELDWLPSPAPGVRRRRVYAEGEDSESVRVTSLVRYDAGASFPYHEHPGGEEIFVLDGVLADERGTYPAGTWILNPELPGHAPYSDEGCLLLVRLRQYPGAEQIVTDTRTGTWATGKEDGIARMVLIDDPALPERIQLERWQPGARTEAHTHAETVELYILDGTFEDEGGAYPAGTWLRAPVGSGHAPFSTEGCTLFTHVGGGAG